MVEKSLYIGEILNQPYQDEFELNLGDGVPFILFGNDEKFAAYAMLEKPSENTYRYIQAFMDKYL
ncbi:MAG: hypothetical protein Q4P18_04860 [Methanobrevibacter sp.]|uniref:hypothetical protein n=1 Tax=Methanobrevibacter sp. TaxID=66852 RepID=UPI0026DFB37E|nr:hypothetical protein [Methanobrevibacter sp.]MDO5848842.1 hypothetical protein [Methanobrevibacter sp.]